MFKFIIIMSWGIRILKDSLFSSFMFYAFVYVYD